MDDMTPATKGDLAALERKMDARFVRMDERFEQIDGRFEQIDGRFAHIDGRFEQIDEKFQRINESIDRILTVVVNMDRRIASQLSSHERRIGHLEKATA